MMKEDLYFSQRKSQLLGDLNKGQAIEYGWIVAPVATYSGRRWQEVDAFIIAQRGWAYSCLSRYFGDGQFFHIVRAIPS